MKSILRTATNADRFGSWLIVFKIQTLKYRYVYKAFVFTKYFFFGSSYFHAILFELLSTKNN